jgi:hypothetical protein
MCSNLRRATFTALAAMLMGSAAFGDEPSGPVDVLAIPTESGDAVATLSFAPGCGGKYHQVFPLAAKVQGVGTSQWQFNVGFYAKQAASVDIALLVKNQANPSPEVVNVQIPAGEEVLLSNVLGTLFNSANAGLGLRYCSGYPLAEGYFYNVGGAPGFVYGTAVPALDPGDATTPIRPAYFHRLEYTPSAVQGQRINIGATSNSSFNVPIAIDLFDGPTLLGTINHTLLPYEHRQFTNVHQMIGAGAVTSGHAVVRTLADEAEIYAYALQVQNKSGDLVYQAASLAAPLYDPLATVFEGSWTGTWNNLTFASSGSISLDLQINEAAGAPSAPVVSPPPQAAEGAGAAPPAGVGEGGVSALANPGPQVATLVMDLGGNVFGGANPPARTLNGYWTESGMRFLGDVATYGHYDIFIQFNGVLFGSLTNVPAAGIASVVMAGKIDQGRLDLTQTINFDNKSTASATWGVTKNAPIFPSPVAE